MTGREASMESRHGSNNDIKGKENAREKRQRKARMSTGLESRHRGHNREPLSHTCKRGWWSVHSEFPKSRQISVTCWGCQDAASPFYKKKKEKKNSLLDLSNIYTHIFSLIQGMPRDIAAK